MSKLESLKKIKIFNGFTVLEWVHKDGEYIAICKHCLYSWRRSPLIVEFAYDENNIPQNVKREDLKYKTKRISIEKAEGITEFDKFSIIQTIKGLSEC